MLFYIEYSKLFSVNGDPQKDWDPSIGGLGAA